ncbi:MAG: hypothetical protein EXS67_06035 [Candidatus Margulisbacteria bacterium]|nr:hypothetical protein [Candidatus Margulisiibacteriota bacterium]
MVFNPSVIHATPAVSSAVLVMEDSKARFKNAKSLSDTDVAALQGMTGQNLKQSGHFVAVASSPRRGFFSAIKQHLRGVFHRNHSYSRLHQNTQFLEGASFRPVVREPVSFLPIQFASRLFRMTGEVVSRAVLVCRQGISEGIYDLNQALQEIPSLFSPFPEVSAEAIRRLEMTHAFHLMLQVSNQRVDQFLHRVEQFQNIFHQFEWTVLRCHKGVRAFKSKISGLVNQIRSLADRFEATRIFQALGSLIFMKESGDVEPSYDFGMSFNRGSFEETGFESSPIKSKPGFSSSLGSFSGLFPQPSSLTLEMFTSNQSWWMSDGGNDYQFPTYNSGHSIFDSDLRYMRDLLPFIDVLCLIEDVQWAFQLVMTYLVVYFSRGYYRLQKIFMSLTLYGEQVKHLTHLLGNLMVLFHSCDVDTWVRQRKALEMLPMIDKNPDAYSDFIDEVASPLLFHHRMLQEGVARLEKVGVDLFISAQSFYVMQSELEASGVLDAMISVSDRLIDSEQQQQFLHLLALIQQMRHESDSIFSQLEKVPDMLKGYVNLTHEADDIVSDILDPLFLSKLQKAEEVFRASTPVL